MNRRLHPVTVQQAAEESPVLARLASLARESAQRLEAIAPLLPAALQACIKPGPIEGPVWCLLVDGNAAAAKLRQLLPVLLNSLRERGWEVTSIRVKVQARAS